MANSLLHDVSPAHPGTIGVVRAARGVHALELRTGEAVWRPTLHALLAGHGVQTLEGRPAPGAVGACQVAAERGGSDEALA